MNCKRAAGFLPLYVAGDLDAARANEVASHVAACGGCRQVADEFSESRALLVEAFATPEFGAEFYSEIRSSVLEKIARDHEPSTPSFVAALFGRRAAYATAFAVALFALAFALQHLRGGTRKHTPPLAQGQQNAHAPKQERREEPKASPQLNAKKNEPTPQPTFMASSPYRQLMRRDAPERRREPMPKTIARDDESAMIAEVTPSSVDGAHEPRESGSPVGGSATSATASAAPGVSRIEIQTADPNIRIIWLAPQKPEETKIDRDQHENGDRK
jgi:hypothetical protein